MTKRILNFKFSTSGGFTVIESIVAILVLSLSVSAAFSSVTTNLSQSNIAKDEIKAFYLAQEAIELIRNRRDTNKLACINDPAAAACGNWLVGLAACIGQTCRADAHAETKFASCGANWDSCEVLRQNPTTFVHGYDAAWAATNFKREIQLEQINASEVSVTVRVFWTKGATQREFKAKTLLLNWI